MTYLGFLTGFIFIPIVLFAGFFFWQRRRSSILRSRAPFLGIIIHSIIALIYATPWDNFLVATKVWWYDPDLVTGVVIGWVPIEEYAFFILQPILVGLWIGVWAGKLTIDYPIGKEHGGQFRLISGMLGGLLWLGSIVLLLSDWDPGTYLALELAWALPPIILQLVFGADLLKEQWRLVLMGIIPSTLYLSVVDGIAIKFGTWTIDPAQSTGLLIGRTLPVEEFVFFFLTNIMLTFGLVLVWNPTSQVRLREITGRSKVLKNIYKLGFIKNFINASEPG